MLARISTLTVRRLAALVFFSSSKANALSTSRIYTTKMIPTEHLVLHRFTEPVSSTQDEARRLLLDHNSSLSLAVIADAQTNGRGTQGRKWEGDGGRRGNLYLTVCVPMERIPVRITLLPLQIAVLVAERVSRLIAQCQNGVRDRSFRTTVKWPNDVLVDEKKISGTLIENEIIGDNTWLLIGIGINVAFAPDLSESPGKQIRGSTCIQDLCKQGEYLSSDAAVLLGEDLACALLDWVVNGDRKEVKEMKVIEDWRSYAEFGKVYELRGNVDDENKGIHHGEEVVSVDIHNDGQLIVRGEDGLERMLIADYMF